MFCIQSRGRATIVPWNMSLTNTIPPLYLLMAINIECCCLSTDVAVAGLPDPREVSVLSGQRSLVTSDVIRRSVFYLPILLTRSRFHNFLPLKDHAVVMCRFARDCLNVFNKMVKRLEVTLGPDTGDLGLRLGLHSGELAMNRGWYPCT